MRSFTGIGASGDDVPQESKQASFFGQQRGWMATNYGDRPACQTLIARTTVQTAGCTTTVDW